MPAMMPSRIRSGAAGRRHAFDSHGAHSALHDAGRAAELFGSMVNCRLPLELFERARTGRDTA